MASFNSLPDEVLEHLFTSDELTFNDLVSLSLTNRQCQCVVQNNNKLWRLKLFQRWPDWRNPPHESNNWHRLFKRRHEMDVQVWLLIQQTCASASLHKEASSEVILSCYDELHKDDQDKLALLIEALFQLTKSSNAHTNLNIRYYARKVYPYILQQKLKQELALLLMPDNENNIKFLEIGAALINQWCCPFSVVLAEDISDQIETIADQVRSHNQSNGGNILSSINHVLYKELNFKGNVNEYYNVDNSFVSKVLSSKRGIPVTLSVIYMALARRFGHHVDGINFPGHFLIGINHQTNCAASEEYIDAFNRGFLLSQDDCIQKFMEPNSTIVSARARMFQKASNIMILIRMMANIINIYRQQSSMNSSHQNMEALRWALKLSVLLDPDNNQNKILLARVCLHSEVFLEEATQILSDLNDNGEEITIHGAGSNTYRSLLESSKAALKERNSENPVQPKYRSDERNKDVAFRIGEVMSHKRYLYTCVIYGWDARCDMTEEWKQRMRVSDLPNGEHQPFFNVLVHEDCSERYAAMENLERMPEMSCTNPISHPHVGKYFLRFDGNCYVAVDALRGMYPEDQPVHGGDPLPELPEGDV